MRACLVLLTGVAACSFQDGAQPPGAGDAGSHVDGPITVGPDAFVFEDAAMKPQAIAFVQGRYAALFGSSNTIIAGYTPEKAHDFNLVVVSSNSASAGVFSVTDTDSNFYTHLDQQISNGSQTLDIWYATDISGDGTGDLVTATYDDFVSNPELRVLELAGIALTNPVDVAVSATTASNSPSSTADSGPATTTHANDLIIGAECSLDSEKSLGSGFSDGVKANGDVVEYMIVSTADQYDATMKLNNSSSWIMRLVAFEGQF